MTRPQKMPCRQDPVGVLYRRLATEASRGASCAIRPVMTSAGGTDGSMSDLLRRLFVRYLIQEGSVARKPKIDQRAFVEYAAVSNHFDLVVGGV